MDNKMTRRLSFIVLTVLLFVLVFTSFSSITYADTATADSDVLTDLGVDETFTDADYPLDNSDKGLYVIQVAESTDKELLVYVYQPCAAKDFRASSINISRQINNRTSFSNYFLTYCNHRGTLYKYKVNDFAVLDDDFRYYSVSQIMRPFDPGIDTAVGNDNSVSEVPYPVAKEWCFHYENGVLTSDCADIETISITDKLVGYIHYSNGGIVQGFNFPAYTDSHLVAFNTDRQIDDLYEADVQWTETPWRYAYDTAFGDVTGERFQETFGDPVVKPSADEPKTLCRDTTVTQEHHYLFAQNFVFNEIQTVEELLAEEDKLEVFYDGVFVKISGNTSFNPQARSALENKQWVLRFCTTTYERSAHQAEGLWWVDRTKVSDVIILRLKFKTAGVMYDLGVIDNKQTGSDDPLAETRYRYEMTDLLKTILWILLLVLILIILFQFGPIIANFLKAIFKIITFPIRAIIAARKRRKEKKRDKQIDALIDSSQRSKPSYRYRR